MARVKIVDPKWAGFSSYIGMTKFNDGVSEDDVSPAELRILGSITKIAIIDDEGNEEISSPAQVTIDIRSMPAPVIPEMKPTGEADQRKEITPGPVTVESVRKEPDEAEKAEQEFAQTVSDLENGLEDENQGENQVENQVDGEKTVYTRESLEEVADEKGIAGLRKIGDEFSVKSNSIEDLITKILSVQKDGA